MVTKDKGRREGEGDSLTVARDREEEGVIRARDRGVRGREGEGDNLMATKAQEGGVTMEDIGMS